jgi:hypothetical protein
MYLIGIWFGFRPAVGDVPFREGFEGLVPHRGSNPVQPAPPVLGPRGREGAPGQLLGVEAVRALLGAVLPRGERPGTPGVLRSELRPESAQILSAVWIKYFV